MPTVTTDAGAPVDVTPADDAATAEFRQSLDDTGPDEKQTPRRQPRAAAADGEKPRARTVKADKARTTDKAAPVKDDYTEDAQKAVGMAWSVAAGLPATQAYALVIEGNSDALVSALAEGAKHSKTIRAFVATGESSWMLQLAYVGLSMGMQTLQLMKDPELRAEAAATTREHLKAAMGLKGIEVPEPAHVPAAA